MKVIIKPYKNYFGPYQLANLARFIGFSEDKCSALGIKLAQNKKLVDFFEWLHAKRDTKREYVKIHSYDTWNMDSTLSHIILPMLIQLRDTKHGSPNVDDDDVPENYDVKGLRSYESLTPKENEYDTDANWHRRWEYVLDEMIWAFEQLADPESEQQFYHYPDPDDIRKFTADYDGLHKFEERKQNGFRLFGKYYQCLWD